MIKILLSLCVLIAITTAKTNEKQGEDRPLESYKNPIKVEIGGQIIERTNPESVETIPTKSVESFGTRYVGSTNRDTIVNPLSYGISGSIHNRLFTGITGGITHSYYLVGNPEQTSPWLSIPRAGSAHIFDQAAIGGRITNPPIVGNTLPISAPIIGHSPIGGAIREHTISEQVIGQYPIGGHTTGHFITGGKSIGHSHITGQNIVRSSISGHTIGQYPLGGQPIGRPPIGGHSFSQSTIGNSHLDRSIVGQNPTEGGILGHSAIVNVNRHSSAPGNNIYVEQRREESLPQIIMPSLEHTVQLEKEPEPITQQKSENNW